MKSQTSKHPQFPPYFRNVYNIFTFYMGGRKWGGGGRVEKRDRQGLKSRKDGWRRLKFVSDLRQVGGFLRVLRFPPPIIPARYSWNIVESDDKHHQTNKHSWIGLERLSVHWWISVDRLSVHWRIDLDRISVYSWIVLDRLFVHWSLDLGRLSLIGTFRQDTSLFMDMFRYISCLFMDMFRQIVYIDG
jgi:hypothetical protein